MDSELLIGDRGLFRAKIRISFHLLGIELSVRQKSALSRKGERAEGEGAPLPPCRGNDLCMTVVYRALAGSAGWWTLKIYMPGGVTETLNLNCLGCCVRLGGATNLRVAVPLLSLRVR